MTKAKYINKTPIVEALEYVVQVGAPDAEGKHPIHAETLLGVINSAPVVDMVERPMWIPVEWYMPKQWVDVLVLNNHKECKVAMWNEKYGWRLGNNAWFEPVDGEITHWMPLPK